MEFFDNRIINPVNGGPSFEEWLAGEITKMAAKEAKPECDGDSRGQCRGQIVNTDNEDGDGYQKGESVTGKSDQKEGKKEAKTVSNVTTKTTAKNITANCGKEMGKCDNAGKVTEKHDEASSTESGSDKKKGKTTKQVINNDPNYQKGESVTMKKKTKKASKIITFEKISDLDHSKKLALFASLTANKEYPFAYAEALSGIKFANLKEDEKKWFADYWSILYPEDYASEMAKDR